jgi:hypothetical protein
MSLQEAPDDRRRPKRQIRSFVQAGGEYMVSGSAFARIVHGSNAEVLYTAVGQWLGGGSTSVGHSVTAYAYSGQAAPVMGEEYDPAFVAKILAADAEPEEEGFDNVVDLLDWLNRD